MAALESRAVGAPDEREPRAGLHRRAEKAYDVGAMGILEYIFKGLGPEARKELATEAARGAVKNVGDAVYQKAESIRHDVEASAQKQREKKERERAEAERRAAAVRAERSLDDELAALKAKVERER